MRFPRIVMMTVLGSMTTALALTVFRELSESSERQFADRPSNDDFDQKSGTATPLETGSNAAIASPEALPVQQLSELATKTAITAIQAEFAIPTGGSVAVQRGEKSQPPATPKTAAAIAPAQRQQNPQLTYTPGPRRQPWVSLTAPVGKISPPEKILPSGADPSVPTGEDASVIPIDVSLNDIQGHWAQYYIEFLSTRFIVRGFPDGSFRPNRAITAAEFNKMMQKAAHSGGIAPVSYGQLQALISNRAATRADAAAFIYRAIVRTELVESVTNVQVSGAVLRPGRYSLAAASDSRLGKGNNLPTLSRAIQQAGGALGSADLRQVEIHRRTDTGERKVIKVDVWKVLAEKNVAQDVVIQQNDRIVIPAIAATAPTQPFRAAKPPGKPISTPAVAIDPPATVASPKPVPAPVQPVPTPAVGTAPPEPVASPLNQPQPAAGEAEERSDRPTVSPTADNAILQ